MDIRNILLILLAALAFAGCDQKKPGTSSVPEQEVPPGATNGTDTEPVPAKPETPRFPVSKAPAPREIWKEFSGDRAMEHVRLQVQIGPRPSGSSELEKVRELITKELEQTGWVVERQEFTDQTPRGAIKFVNLIGRFAADGARPVPANTQRALVLSHYDTKRFSTIRFVGASDAGSSTGALIELARVLSLDPKLASQVELVFFDGEEAIEQFTETDGLYGSRHYARSLRESGRVKQFQFGILWDMIGDRDLTITLPPDSPPEVAKSLLASAEALGVRQKFSFYNRSIWDDHVPLNQAGIPTIDVIDFDYLFWHSADDTLDKLSPESLQTVGAVTLHKLAKSLAR